MEGKSRSEDEALRAHSFFSFKMKFLLSAGDNKVYLFNPYRFVAPKDSCSLFPDRNINFCVPSSPSTFSMDLFLSTILKLLYGNKHKRFRFQPQCIWTPIIKLKTFNPAKIRMCIRLLTGIASQWEQSN